MIYFNCKQNIGVISEIRVMTVKLPIASLIFQKGFSDAASSLRRCNIASTPCISSIIAPTKQTIKFQKYEKRPLKPSNVVPLVDQLGQRYNYDFSGHIFHFCKCSL